MGKIKEREYTNYDDDKSLLEEAEEFVESELQVNAEDPDALLEDEETVRFRRTWRDTEKYKEVQELYKIINDDLYTGFEAEEFPEDEA